MNKDEFFTTYAPETERMRPDDITAGDASKRWGVSYAHAARRLNALADDGILEKITNAKN